MSPEFCPNDALVTSLGFHPREENEMASAELPAIPAGNPVRGALRVVVSSASPQVVAGRGFSIFVEIQNPFEIPVKIGEVRTHIPVELIDTGHTPPRSKVAVALEADYAVWVSSHPPDNPNLDAPNPSPDASGGLTYDTPNELLRGERDVTLQPGDKMVKQFVLGTTQWLLFTPLMHKFLIEINYEGDGIAHRDTVAYEQNIRSTLSAICVGSAVGAIFGSLLKSFNGSPVSANLHSVLEGLFVSLVASTAVVVAFARKANAQPIISIEDFWGGAVLGFTVGFFGFDRFSGLFTITH
jgi:hypothetical protein